MRSKKTLNTAIKNFLILISISLFILIILLIFSKKHSCFSDQKSAILDKYNPICTVSGNYMPLQKWEIAKYSWCTTKDGIIIPNTYKKINSQNTEKYNYYKDIRFNECVEVRKNMSINQKLIVLIGKIYSPYIS
tara:strand:- start:15099 stop:15500 length:402 start_codon:yes stop_codon:yes gene_type:complete